MIGLQAPLSFLNAYQFQQALQALPKSGVRLVVIEANAIVEIDYTGAKILGDEIKRLRAKASTSPSPGWNPFARRRASRKQGLEALIGKDHLFHSVEEAISALRPGRSR